MNTIFITSLNKSFSVDIPINQNVAVYFGDNVLGEEPASEVCVVRNGVANEHLNVIFENNEYCVNFI